MLVSVLASGSEGNITYIETKDKVILIDLGMNYKYLVTKLEELNKTPEDVDYVLITHTHKDHTGAMSVFFKHHHPVVFMDKKMLDELPFLNGYEDIVFDDGTLNFNNLVINIVKTSHDAPGSRAYIIEEGTSSVVYITDTGYINKKWFDMLSNRSLYIFESNHDIELLMHGSYPSWLKSRIRGDVGHLSNNQSGFYLSKFIGDSTKKVILAHLSKENNSEELALKTVKDSLISNNIEFDNFLIAKQKEKTEVIEI